MFMQKIFSVYLGRMNQAKKYKR